jgi:hypothetical protein
MPGGDSNSHDDGDQVARDGQPGLALLRLVAASLRFATPISILGEDGTFLFCCDSDTAICVRFDDY